MSWWDTGNDRRQPRTLKVESDSLVFRILTSAQLVVGSVAVEIVALAELAIVDLCRILSLMAFAGAADAVAVFAADVRTVVFPALGVQVLGLPLVPAALAEAAYAALVAPEIENDFALLQGNIWCSKNSLRLCSIK